MFGIDPHMRSPGPKGFCRASASRQLCGRAWAAESVIVRWCAYEAAQVPACLWVAPGMATGGRRVRARSSGIGEHYNVGDIGQRAACAGRYGVTGAVGVVAAARDLLFV
jgi:hypothetical protein